MSKQRRNANIFGALRLLFALAVIFDHIWEVNFGQRAVDPLHRFVPDIGTGPAAVMGFFAVSGLLIAMSAQRNTARRYLALRMGRIYPGWIVAVFVVGLVMEPILYAIVHRTLSGAPWTGAHSMLSYGAMNAGMIELQTTIPGVVGHGMVAGVDGPLWTIKWEFSCYLIGLACVLIGRRLHRHADVGLAWSMCAVMVVVRIAISRHVLSPGQTQLALPVCMDMFSFSLCFGIGLRRQEWLTDRRTQVGVLVLFTSLIAAGAWTGAGEFLFPLAVIVVGSMPLGGLLAAIGRRWDISYGLYLYAWPVQQMLAARHVLIDHLALLFPLTVLLTLPLAAASWWLVESRALNVVHRATRNRAAAVPAATAVPAPLPAVAKSVA